MGIRDEIAKVAYELYEKRGGTHGSHLDDWLEAEKIVMARHARKESAGIKLSKSGKARSSAKPKREEKAGPAKTTSRKRTTSKKSALEKT